MTIHTYARRRPRMGLDLVWNWRHLGYLLLACAILSAWIGWGQ